MILLRILITLLTLTLLCSSCAKKIEEEYYPNGKLKMKVELKDGKRHGVAFKYDSTGTLQIKSHWENGIENGPVFFYYPNGKVEQETVFKNGKPHGQLRAYAENGKLDYIADYCEGTLCGDEIKYYYGTGIKAELNRFDRKGEQFYAERYDTTGKTEMVYYIPDLIGRQSPLKLNKAHDFTIAFAEPIRGKIYAVIGESDQYRNKHPKITTVIDTLYSKDNRTFPFKFVPTKLGMHYLTGIVYHEPLEGDSLWVNGTSVKYAFEVVE
ncbi:toxin-antitoxin system YwqK family antitoxin [Sabulibacter ruber]|uniref:toxin-antitoxin system YwqK family antitoxin n=1 Tax=Sabulibacter ruber TaxID=2811901 RepID=UPI001A970D55|nr:toxin-antitoxin system YwqK family antitoxin [Sabulibacter ruber]